MIVSVRVFTFFLCKQKTAYDMRISDWSSDVCSSDLHFGPRLQDQPLGNALVQFGFDTCRQIAPGRQESGPVDLEHIGRKALHADDGMGTLGTGQVLPDTSLQVPPRADRMAPKSLDFGGLGRSEEHTSELQSLMRISYAVFC